MTVSTKLETKQTGLEERILDEEKNSKEGEQSLAVRRIVLEERRFEGEENVMGEVA